MTEVVCGFFGHPLSSLQRLRALPGLADRFVPASVKLSQRGSTQAFTYDNYLDQLAELTEPFQMGTVTGLVSPAGARLKAHVIVIPLTPKQFNSLPEELLVEKLVAAARLAVERGAAMVGLGGYTAAGGLGLLAAPRIEPGVTSGNAFTAYAAVVGSQRALEARGERLDNCTVCVVGATGSVGHGVTAYLARHSSCELVVCGRHRGRLELLAGRLHAQGGRIRCETDIRTALGSAQVVITATSHGEPFVDARWCREGAVVCDIALPPDVIESTVKLRPDLLVFDGGVVDLPGTPRLDFRPMLRYGLRYACFAETAILTLSGQRDDFALGRVTGEEVERIAEMAARHGFSVGDLRWNNQIVLPRPTAVQVGGRPGKTRSAG
jgi:predicted amino acid dehydrogenase